MGFGLFPVEPFESLSDREVDGVSEIARCGLKSCNAHERLLVDGYVQSFDFTQGRPFDMAQGKPFDAARQEPFPDKTVNR